MSMFESLNKSYYFIIHSVNRLEVVTVVKLCLDTQCAVVVQTDFFLIFTTI